MLLRTPTLISSEVGHGKTKPSRWLERSPKMMNLHECHCLRKLSKYEKQQKHIGWGPTDPPPPPHPPTTLSIHRVNSYVEASYAEQVVPRRVFLLLGQAQACTPLTAMLTNKTEKKIFSSTSSHLVGHSQSPFYSQQICAAKFASRLNSFKMLYGAER